MVDRAFFEETVRRCRLGFKILLDLFASSPGALRRGALPLPPRVHGEQAGCAGPARVRPRSATSCSAGMFPSASSASSWSGCSASSFTWRCSRSVSSRPPVLSCAGRRDRGGDHGQLSISTMRSRIATDGCMDARWCAVNFRSMICSIGAVFNAQIAEMLFNFRVPWALAGCAAGHQLALELRRQFGPHVAKAWQTASSRGGDELMLHNPDAGPEWPATLRDPPLRPSELSSHEPRPRTEGPGAVLALMGRSRVARHAPRGAAPRGRCPGARSQPLPSRLRRGNRFHRGYVPEAQRFLDGEPLLSEFHPPCTRWRSPGCASSWAIGSWPGWRSRSSRAWC